MNSQTASSSPFGSLQKIQFHPLRNEAPVANISSMNCERYWYGKMRSASPRRAFWSARFILLTLVLLITPHDAAAAQRQFFVFQAPPSETVPAGLATNFVVT